MREEGYMFIRTAFGDTTKLRMQLTAMTTARNKALEALKWLTGFYQDGDKKACKKLIEELETIA